MVLLGLVEWPKKVGRETGAWQQMCTQPGEEAAHPFPTYGYSAVAIEEDIWVFGGITLSGQCIDGLFRFSIPLRRYPSLVLAGQSLFLSGVSLTAHKIKLTTD